MQSFYNRETNSGQMMHFAGSAGGLSGLCEFTWRRCGRCNLTDSGMRVQVGTVHVLVINSGSSSIKFSLFDSGTGEPRSLFEGEVTGIGGGKAGFKFRDADGRDLSGGRTDVKAETPVEAIGLVVEAVSGQGLPKVEAVGYRVVHPGAKLDRHQRITPEVMRGSGGGGGVCAAA